VTLKAGRASSSRRTDDPRFANRPSRGQRAWVGCQKPARAPACRPKRERPGVVRAAARSAAWIEEQKSQRRCCFA
jgi:hypothetical protein